MKPCAVCAGIWTRLAALDGGYVHLDPLEVTHLLEERRQQEQRLGDLLATIHCDGGHHQAAVGTEQAVKDAIDLWDKLPRDAEGRLKLVDPNG